jgi:hypothetical protein
MPHYGWPGKLRLPCSHCGSLLSRRSLSPSVGRTVPLKRGATPLRYVQAFRASPSGAAACRRARSICRHLSARFGRVGDCGMSRDRGHSYVLAGWEPRDFLVSLASEPALELKRTCRKTGATSPWPFHGVLRRSSHGEVAACGALPNVPGGLAGIAVPDLHPSLSAPSPWSPRCGYTCSRGRGFGAKVKRPPTGAAAYPTPGLGRGGALQAALC